MSKMLTSRGQAMERRALAERIASYAKQKRGVKQEQAATPKTKAEKIAHFASRHR